MALRSRRARVATQRNLLGAGAQPGAMISVADRANALDGALIFDLTALDVGKLAGAAAWAFDISRLDGADTLAGRPDITYFQLDITSLDAEARLA